MNINIKTEELFLIPLQSICIITAKEDVTILTMKLSFNITFCDHLPLEIFLEEYSNSKKNDDIGLLEPNVRLTNYANIVKDYIEDGLKCSFFFDVKIREFLYLIRVYYDKKDVYNFFSSIYCNDLLFSNKIYQHIDNIKTVKEFAKALNYSLSGFEKRFKKVFNKSPYQWVLEHKAKKIYHEINCSKKTFSELAFEFGFSSPAHFNDFCKLQFGNPPGKLRKKLMDESAVLFENDGN